MQLGNTIFVTDLLCNEASTPIVNRGMLIIQKSDCKIKDKKTHPKVNKFSISMEYLLYLCRKHENIPKAKYKNIIVFINHKFASSKSMKSL